MSDKLVRIKNRYDTADNWYNENPILAAGEIGIDSTNNEMRIGIEGGMPWTGLVPIGTRDFVFKKQIQINNGSGGISSLYIKKPGNGEKFLARYNYMKIEIPGCFDMEFDISFENSINQVNTPTIRQYPYMIKNISSDISEMIRVIGVYSSTDANMSKIGDIEFKCYDSTSLANGPIMLEAILTILDDSIFPKDEYLIATTTLKNIDKYISDIVFG